MNLPPLPLVNGAMLIDNSFLETLSQCPRSLQYSRLNKRILSNERPALNFGSAIHLALEYRYKVYQNIMPDVELEEAQGTILSEYFAAHPAPLEDFRTLNWAQQIITRYNNKYNLEGFQLLKYDEPVDCVHCEGTGFKPPHAEHEEEQSNCIWCSGVGRNSMMVELPFALPLFNYTPYTDYPDNGQGLPTKIPVIYTGRIDLPVLRDNQLFILDHKTTSMLGEQFWNKLKMSAQQKGYAWAFEQLTGRTVQGFGVNALRVKEPTLKMQKDEKEAQKWWGESLDRQFYYLNEGELDEWKTNAIALVEEFFWHYQRDFMPQKTPACTLYGKCAYFDVCSTFPPSSRTVMLQSGMFTDNTWSPLNQPKTKEQTTT